MRSDGGGFFEWIDGLSTGWKAVAIIATAAVGAAIVLSGAGAGLGLIASIIPAIAVTTR